VKNIKQTKKLSAKKTLNVREKPNKAAYFDSYKKEVENLSKKLDAVAKNGLVKKYTAIHFIEKSAWWLTHSAGPVRAPGDANNLEGPENMPILKFGANTFHVGEALLKCRQVLQDFLTSAQSNPNFGKKALSELMKRLVAAICGSVSAFDGRAYNQYSMKGDEMIFGAHAINVKEFIDCLFEMVPVDRFIRKYLEAKQKDQNTEEAINVLKSILKKTDKKNFPSISLIAAEMKRRDPKFNIKSTHFKRFTDLLLHCTQKQQPKGKRAPSQESSQEELQNKLKFSKAMKKHYKAMLSSENRSNQVENAILTLQFADNFLREREKIERKSVFSALAETIHRNHGDVRQLGSLLSSLFSHQHASIKEKQISKPNPKTCSQVEVILMVAGFKLFEDDG